MSTAEPSAPPGAPGPSSSSDCITSGTCPWLFPLLLSSSAVLALVAVAACACVFRYRRALRKLQRRSEETSAAELPTRAANLASFSSQRALPPMDETAAIDNGAGLLPFLGLHLWSPPQSDMMPCLS